jgi:hypothetical protein
VCEQQEQRSLAGAYGAGVRHARSVGGHPADRLRTVGLEIEKQFLSEIKTSQNK